MRPLILIGLLIIALGACAPVDTAARERAERLAALLQDLQYDFDPLSPGQQRDAADVVVVGTVVDVVEGRVLPIARGISHANLVVKVDRALKGSAPGETIYVEVMLSSRTSWSDVKAVAPRDRVLLFLDDRNDQRASGAETGRPSGADIYAPFVQGLIVEASGDWLSGLIDRSVMGQSWDDLHTFDDVVAAAK